MKKFTFLFLIIASLLAFNGCETKEPEPPVLGDVHNHADLKVYINNVPFNFAQEKYMSGKEQALNNFMHFHDMDGEVVHQHMSTIKLKDFFSSLGMQLGNDCFVTDEGKRYCNEGDKTLKMFVNGTRQNDIETYEFKDLDRILITYGNDDETTIQKQIASVTDKACIQSQKCPERGKPHDESTCVTGGTTDCLPATPLTQETQETQGSNMVEIPVKISLVALEDNGKTGKAMGCGDSIVAVERKITVLATEHAPVENALLQLFSIKNQKDPVSGLYNALYQSNLKVESAEIGEKAIIHLTGNYTLGGSCDTPRFEEQLKETVLQNSGAKEVEIFINDKPLKEALSVK